MQTSFNPEALEAVTFLTGDAQMAARLPQTAAKEPFEDGIVAFLNDVSKAIMSSKSARLYSDVMTFGFWIRKSSVLHLKERFAKDPNQIRLGKGVAFHIAPSNVPVNFAYSLAAGLLCGNANVVRIPSKPFPQVDMLVDAFRRVLETHPEMKPYVLLVRYDRRNKAANDAFSSVADVRIVWGGDATIAELRKSPLPPRAGEITFADRYSIAVIDADSYLRVADKTRVAEDFYNDTFFSDQNACTSPHVIVWVGSRIEEAKPVFWEEAHRIVQKKYAFQAIQGVNKLTKSCLVAVAEDKVKIEKHSDNLIIRVSVPEISERLMDYRDNSGYFYEYHCQDIMEIKDLCNDNRCQTIAYIGDKNVVLPLLQAGVRGIDRVVPMGKTMDFDLIWDGYQLSSFLTRTIVMA